MNGNVHTSQRLSEKLSRLSPDVFYHSIWAHFVEAEAPPLPQQIQPLLDAADEMLSTGNLGDACRLLFICAFQQLRMDDFAAASSTIQRILVLAEQHGLPQVAWWAAWGAAAICVQHGWCQQAAEHLEHLHSMLGWQHEWILSDVIDVLRQDLLCQAEVTPADRPLLSDLVLSPAFEQLLHWGTPCAMSVINVNGLTGHDGHAGHAIPLSGTDGFTWHSLWHKIKCIVKGELQLKWVETNGSAPLPHPGERNVLIPSLPIIVAALAPAQMPPSIDQPPTLNQQPELDRPLTSVQDQEPVAIQPVAPDQPEPAAESPASPSITAHLLGTFSFSVNDATVQSWPTGKGRAVFKYLLAHHDQPIPRDVLMDVFWPQAGPEAARNSLNVALHGLRQALKTVTDKPVILFEEGAYCINLEFHIWIDVDEFDRHVQAGRRLEANGQVTKAAAEYEAAIGLYQGDFLSGDFYEEWPVLTRERLRVTYLDNLDRLSHLYFDRKQYAACIAACQQILARDNCREDAYCRLMQCYSRQEQHHLALRQYQTCVEALRSELNVDPAPATTQLYERIRRRERV